MARLIAMNGMLCIRLDFQESWQKPSLVAPIFSTGLKADVYEHLIDQRLEYFKPTGAYTLPGRFSDGPVWHAGEMVGSVEVPLSPPSKRGWTWVHGEWRHTRTGERVSWIEADRRQQKAKDAAWAKLQRTWDRQDRKENSMK